jgi:hypothetical protein
MYINVTVNHGAPDWEEPEFHFDGTPDQALMEAVKRYPKATSLVLSVVLGDKED